MDSCARKLKQIHQKRYNLTLVYVTHDQNEALTFADQVVVMQEGEVVQMGTPVDLFERPTHTFVGHFIGSPGMNVLPCELRGDGVFLNDTSIEIGPGVGDVGKAEQLEIGVRPEFVRFADKGLPVDIIKVADAGRYRVVETRAGDHRVHLLARDGETIPSDKAHLVFDPARTRVYADGWLTEREG